MNDTNSDLSQTNQRLSRKDLEDRRNRKTNNTDMKASVGKKSSTHRKGEMRSMKGSMKKRIDKRVQDDEESLSRDGSVEVNATAHLPDINVPDLKDKRQKSDHVDGQASKDSIDIIKQRSILK